MSRSVAIWGTATMPDMADWVRQWPSNVRHWALNDMYVGVPDIRKFASLWFDIHPRDWKEGWVKQAGLEWHKPPNCFGRDEEHVTFLKESKIPVIMREKFPEFPMSERYPFEAVHKKFGRTYLTCTHAYMLAFALLDKDIKDIYIAGVELAIGTELIWQRPCFEYYCGYAQAKGVRLHFNPNGTSLLNAPVYAQDPPVVHPKDYTREPKQYVLPVKWPQPVSWGDAEADAELVAELEEAR